MFALNYLNIFIQIIELLTLNYFFKTYTINELNTRLYSRLLNKSYAIKIYMNNLHTEETYIRYYYGESDLFETMEIDFLLTDDIEANMDYSEFSNNIQLLDTVKLVPSQNAIDKILAYSQIKAVA